MEGTKSSYQKTIYHAPDLPNHVMVQPDHLEQQQMKDKDLKVH